MHDLQGLLFVAVSHGCRRCKCYRQQQQGNNPGQCQSQKVEAPTANFVNISADHPDPEICHTLLADANAVHGLRNCTHASAIVSATPGSFAKKRRRTRSTQFAYGFPDDGDGPLQRKRSHNRSNDHIRPTGARTEHA